MAKRMRLKVFQAQFGFYDTVVAASSQAAALRAWGIHQNLFASGQAKLTTDEAATKAALERPETPLRRPIGSKSAFVLDPVEKPVIPHEREAKSRHESAGKPSLNAAKAKKATEKPPADRSRVDAAEKELDEIEEDRKREEAKWDERVAALEAKRQTAQQAYVKRRNTAAEALASARRAYRADGGRD